MDEHDEAIINIKIREMEYSVDLIKRRIPKTLEEFLKLDELLRDGIYKRIEFIIQNILDILAIFTKYIKKIPGDDIEIINLLVEARLISKQIGDKIREMKAFRNFLVHRYGELFHEIAYENIMKGFSDIDNVLKEIKKAKEMIDP